MFKLFTKQNKALLAELVKTDFKLRYQGSALGYTWSLLRPLLLFVILYIVFVRFLRLGSDIPHYPVYLLTGIVLWNFFLEMTAQSLGSIVGRGDLIRKIHIPSWIIVFGSSISALINFGLNLIVIVIFMVLNHVDPMKTILIAPLLLLEIYIFALGVSFFLAALFVRFRDMNYVWEVVLQAGFYMTPILYPLSTIHNLTLQKLVFLNPLAQAIQDFRYCIITHDTTTIYHVFQHGWQCFIPYAIVGIVLVTGALYFRSQSPDFAENI